MKKEKLVAQLNAPFFADRATIGEAYGYFYRVADRLKGTERKAVVTAMCVLLNTVAKEINKLEV